LLSRAAVYVLQPLVAADLQQLIVRALKLYEPSVVLDESARMLLVEWADGDARRLLNTLETVLAAARDQHCVQVTSDFLCAVLPASVRRFDKGGEQFYDQISALHKAVRGSNPDAALYWMVRMLDGGVDPRYIARRLIRMASEDIGLADPRALHLALNAAETHERLGAPEAEVALAQAVLYLAVAPKSNAVYKALKAARAFVAGDSSRPVPMHLRNAPTRLMQELGYGQGYRYAHDEADGYAAGVQYWPEGMAAPCWYQPTERGLEARITLRLQELRARDAAGAATLPT
jgi:putative ATPase